MTSVPFVLPRSGDMIDGVVARWYKPVGSRVEEGELLVEVDMAKASVELESPATGVLSEILVAEDETANVGDVLAIITAA